MTDTNKGGQCSTKCMYYESENKCERHGTPPKHVGYCYDSTDKKHGYSKYKSDQCKQQRNDELGVVGLSQTEKNRRKHKRKQSKK